MPEITLPARADCLRELLAFVGDAMNDAGVSDTSRKSINIAAEEIFINIAAYAYPEGGGDITLRVSAEEGLFTLEFRDKGAQYDPLAKPDPDTSLSAGARDIGGLGVFLVKKLMDSVAYTYNERQNILTMRKRR